MSRRALISAVVGLGALVAVGAGCEQLDGRNRTRTGNRMFGDKEFIDAAAEYEKALTEVDDPIIHYNLALAYSKVFHPGSTQKYVILDVQGSFVCSTIPNVTSIQKQVCVKEGDKHFEECDDKHVCASSFQCQQATLCQAENSALADMSAKNFEQWLTANPTDSETRGLMTQVWLDSSQYDKALEFWNGLLQQKPNDPEIMGSLAGINLKAGDWRKSIEWYNKVADATTDVSAKVAAYQFIGNVAWSKLNSRTLTAADSVELADRGIGALQKAAQLQPDNPKPVGLQASIFNFRGNAHGASWAGSLDRASAQELQHASRVLRDKAKKAQESAPGGTPAPAPAGAASTSDPASPHSLGGG
jgi:tetratricopeptide (TPR) repeat protein